MSGRWIGDTLRYNEMQGWNYCLMENQKGKGINSPGGERFHESISSHVNADM